MEYKIMREKRLELLQYRADRIEANKLADLTSFGIMLFVGLCIWLRLIGG
jgi:hypothetical protein